VADVPAPLTLDTIRDAPKVLLHDHLDGGLRPGTVIELADALGYTALPSTDTDELAGWFAAASQSGSLVRYLERFDHAVGVMQTADALVRVAAECAEDLAADGVVYVEVRFAPELHVEQGLELDAVVEAVLEGFRVGTARAADRGRRIRVGCLLTAMRHAARSREIAELAVRYRDLGVVGFDIAGAEAGFPPTRHLDAFEYLRQQNAHFTIHAGEAFGLPSIWEALQWCGADRLGHGVRIVDDITLGADGTPQLGLLAAYVRDVERAHRGREVAGRPPHRAARRAEVPRHGEHRQPAHVERLDDQRDDRARGHVRLRVGGPAVVHRQRHEVVVHRLRRAARHDQRGHQARVRRPDGVTIRWRPNG
jgi:adenosine deaminase